MAQTEYISIKKETLEKLLSLEDVYQLKLFLLLINDSEISLEQASARLDITLNQAKKAYSQLKSKGIIETTEVKIDELPNFSVNEITGFIKKDKSFEGICSFASSVFGRPISTYELNSLLRIYNFLGLSHETVCILINYTVKQSMEKTNRPPTIKQIEREAFIWERDGITTPEVADLYVKNQSGKTSFLNEISKKLSITQRRLTQTEEKYILSWHEKDISSELIYEAYDKTVTNTGALKWSYLNKILENWASNGYKTLEDVRKNDKNQPKPKSQTDYESSIILKNMQRYSKGKEE